MLSDPNDDSPANIDAAVRMDGGYVDTSISFLYFVYNVFLVCLYEQKEWRENRPAFKRRVKDIVRRSQESL